MSESHVSSKTRKTPLYGNCKVLNQENEHIFNCGPKRCRWYLKKGLAEVIEDNPLVIRLNFETRGDGNKNDEFYLSHKHNHCVCCGSTENLTRHHIVPAMYRCYFPDELKDHSSHDILPLCLACHEKYETHANALKRQIMEELGIAPIKVDIDRNLKRVCMFASTLLKNNTGIPEDRREMMLGVLREYYGRAEITNEDIAKAAVLRYDNRRADHRPEGQLVVENLTNIEAFVKRWRAHFLTTLEPRYIPAHWSVDRSLADK